MNNNTRRVWAPAVSINFAHFLRVSLIDYFLVLFGRGVRVSSAKARTCLHSPPTPFFILTIPQLSIVHVCVLSCFSHVFVTLWTVAQPQGSPVRGILRARILEWVSMPSSGDLPHPQIRPMSLTSPALAGGFFTTCATWEAHFLLWSIAISHLDVKQK